MICKNAAVISASTPLSNARIARNEVFYNENTGHVDIAADTKSYIKSVTAQAVRNTNKFRNWLFISIKV